VKIYYYRNSVVVFIAEFSRCGKDMGLLLPFKCRKQNTAMKNCMGTWSVAASGEILLVVLLKKYTLICLT